MDPNETNILTCSHKDPNDKSSPCDICLQNINFGQDSGSSVSIRLSNNIVGARDPPDYKTFHSLHTSASQTSSSVNVSSLNTIPELHLKANPYKCEYCPEMFSKSLLLLILTRIHTGKKPFICEICKKSFSQKGHLKTHLKIHTREKKFVCTECNERFLYEKDLTTHINSVHQFSYIFECDICNKDFTQKYNMLKHRRTHKEKKHKENMLHSKQYNRNIYLNGAQKNVSSSTHSLNSIQEVSKAVSQNAHLDISIIECNQRNLDDINDDCRSSETSQIFTETSSADINHRNKAHYLSSLGPCIAELPNQIAEWNHSWENMSNASIFKYLDDTPFSPSHFFSETANDIRTANPLSDSENGYQSSVLESDRPLIQAFGWLESQAGQMQQQPAEQSPEEDILNLLENGKYFEGY